MESTPSRSAALFLKLMNPVTRKIEVNLEAARDTIDTLEALEARSRGNLEPDEARVLKQALTDLRLNYVEALKKSGSQPREPAAGS